MTEEVKEIELKSNISEKKSAEEQDSGKEEIKIVIFILDKERYGIEIPQVKEIVYAHDHTTIPNAPEYILGLFDLRGEIVVLIDLEKRFLLERKGTSKRNHIVVCESEGGILGIAVDEVEEIITVGEEELKEPEGIIKEKISPEFISGILVHEDKVLIVLDVKKILKKDELKEFKNKSKEVKTKSKKTE